MLWSWIKIIHVTPAPDIAVNYPTVGHQCCGNEGSLVELETNLREVWNIITEKASTKVLRAFSWLRAATTAFTFKIL